MKKWLLGTTLVLLLGGSAKSAVVDGVSVADSVRVGNTALILNGAGRRTRYFFSIYVAALYLRSHTADAAQVLADPGPMRLTMTLMRNLSASELAGALHEGIARNASPADLARTKSQIDQLIGIMKAIGSAKAGDILSIDFLAGGITRVGLNGRVQGAPIAGRKFQRELLDIWLGPHPAQADLKRELLGAPP
ncbi:MAG: chalcone isomerase family protein [Steroidobacteraceae bacterium]|nr:chalcone isomerase family protein [Steroidobacteraceae bacterium]